MNIDTENYIIYDFEVFQYDVLLGCLICTADGETTLLQTWDTDEMRAMTVTFGDYVWIGHNNNHYDDIIFQGILNGANPYRISKDIVERKIYYENNFKLLTYDVLNSSSFPWSLKVSEAVVGKSIETTDVDFNTPRPLTDEEKKLTEKYNQADLSQTKYNFEKFFDEFKLRVDMIEEFNLEPVSSLRMTDTRLIESIFRLGKSCVYPPYARTWLPQFKFNENEESVKSWYLNGGETSLTYTIGDYSLAVEQGGLHGARKKYQCKKCIEVDVTSLYPSLIINYNLFPRSMSEENKAIYTDMYNERRRIKKTDPRRQKILKKILNSVYGASNAQFSRFYDPTVSRAIATTGEVFMLDLTEKLAPYVNFIQNNTDGIIFEPKDWNQVDKIKEITSEWERRTHLDLEWDVLTNFYQRDVNNYCCRMEDGEVVAKGEMFKTNSVDDETFVSKGLFTYTEPPIIGRACLDYFLDGVKPEETVEKYKNQLLYFAYVCKKGTFSELKYTERSMTDFSQSERQIQSPSRAFASNNQDLVGSVIKCKSNKTSKVSNLPMNVFVYNDEIVSEEAIRKVSEKINWQYYIDRAYEKISC